MKALAPEDPQKAEIVKLRFFVGLDHEEVAKLRLFQNIKAGQ